MAASATGQTIIYGQSQSQSPTGCGSFTIFIADETVAGSRNYSSRDLTTFLTANSLFTNADMAALSADGLAMIVISGDKKSFLSTQRSALQATDFATPSPLQFAPVNASLSGNGMFRAPTLSADGLEFYYTVYGIGAGVDGVYRANRSSVTVPFSAGAKVTAITADYEYVTSVSSDALTLFVFKGFGTFLFTRNSTSAEFTNPNAPNPPPQIPGWDNKVFADCKTMVTTTGPGGCKNEDILFRLRL